MGKYNVVFTKTAKEQVVILKKSGDKATIRKLATLLNELLEHPTEGTGRPEQLLYLSNTWSRRLNKKDRLVYRIEDNIVLVTVLSVLGHYRDK